MVIQRITIYKANIPLKAPFKIALGTTESARNIFVSVETDEGVKGWGEASPFSPVVSETQDTCVAIGADIAKVLIGHDPLDVRGCMRQVERRFPLSPTIRSAFDMALYDILGQVANLPLYALLGGGYRELVTDCTVGIDEPTAMAVSAKEIQKRGFPVVKIKLGTTVEEDLERLKAVREALGPNFPIRVDANQGWGRVEALRALRAMARFRIEFCEQPVAAWDLASMQMIRRHSSIPIMADEALFNLRDALRLIQTEACDYFNIKLAKSGGITEALRIISLAESVNIPCMIGCMTETRLGLTAAAHLAVAFPIIRFVDLDGADMHSVDPVMGGLQYSGKGEIVVSDKPGLGVDVNEDFLGHLERLEIC
jgi:L-alanine-DL-glutamate epimerase-like enolase superfamily enzyme